MGKFAHLNEREIVSHVEKFGTADERDLLAKIYAEPDWSECPNCEQSWAAQELAESEASEATEERDEIVAGVKGAHRKISKVIDLLSEAQEDLE